MLYRNQEYMDIRENFARDDPVYEEILGKPLMVCWVRAFIYIYYQYLELLAWNPSYGTFIFEKKLKSC